MNDDRISEVYKGEIWTEALQDRARRRIHWLCSQVSGQSVLDVGCSQGIASILLAREGFSVVGVDIQESRIEYARTELAKELPETQALATFQVANAAQLPFEDHTFDSALLGEVIEHLTNPDRVLQEVKRVVKPGGRIALTTPFGLSPHHDHKQTFYPGSLLAALSSVVTVESVEVVDRYFRIVCTSTDPTEAHKASFAAASFDELDGVWSTFDLDLLETRRSLAETKKEAAATADRLSRQLDAAVQARESVGAKLTQEQQAAAAALRSIRTELERERQARQEAEAEKERSEAAVRNAKDAANARAERDWKVFHAALVGAIERENDLLRRITKLESERWKLRNRLAVARWKLASARQRKWSRMGSAIGAVRHHPWRILVLPFDLVSILFSKSQLPKRPESLPEPSRRPLREVEDPNSRSTTMIDGTPQAPTSPTVPRLRPLIVAAPSSMSLAPPDRPRQREVRVAAILDEMSHDCFAPECHLVSPTPTDWLELLEAQQPHLLLVESAWRGNQGSWQYKVGTYSYPESVGLPDLTALVEWCRARSVPTVFWNKEDPIHFEKFKEAAAIFDVVLTTDVNMIERYKTLPGNSGRVVDVLPFAAQLAIHNPVGSLQSRDPRPVFAGAFYRNRHPERREQLEHLLDGALGHDLVIYDRMNGQTNESFGFPERFKQNIAGTVPYNEMADVYRRHAVFLNANSVVDSPTMFSRRVFELLASGTPVVSTPSVGVERMFPAVVKTVTGSAAASAAIGELLQDHDLWMRRSCAGIEAVASEHTYADRLARILSLAGVDASGSRDGVSLVVSAEAEPWRPDESRDIAQVLVVGESQSRRAGWSTAIEYLDSGSGPVTDNLRDASGEWIAYGEGDVTPTQLSRLWVGARLANSDVVGFAPGWETAHTFGDELPTGPLLVATSFVKRYGWPKGTRPAGARIYLVPPNDDE